MGELTKRIRKRLGECFMFTWEIPHSEPMMMGVAAGEPAEPENPWARTDQEIAQQALNRITKVLATLDLSGDALARLLPIITAAVAAGRHEGETHGVVMGVRHAANSSDAVHKILNTMLTAPLSRREP